MGPPEDDSDLYDDIEPELENEDDCYDLEDETRERAADYQLERMEMEALDYDYRDGDVDPEDF